MELDEEDVGRQLQSVGGAADAVPLVYGAVQLGGGLDAALRSGNVQTTTAEHMELTEESAAVRDRQAAVINELTTRRRARSLAIPTDDKLVRAALRERGEPITLFGEREMERRERLRQLLAEADAADGGELPAPADAEVLTEAPVAELFYTEGSDALLQTRLSLARSSLLAAQARLSAERERAAAALPPLAVASGEEALGRVAALAADCSCVADTRPLSALALSPDAQALVVGGWSGQLSVWHSLARGCERRLTLRAHEERVTSVAWLPCAPGEAAGGTLAFASAACDKTAKLWASDGVFLCLPIPRCTCAVAGMSKIT